MPASIKPEDGQPDPAWLMPDELWTHIQPLLPPAKPKGKGTKGGRPNAVFRRSMDAIFYVLRTGGQWKALPRSLGAGSTAHDYFQAWTAAGVFEQLWRLGLEQYDVCKGIQWDWQALDGAITKAPLAARRLAPIQPIGPRREPSGKS